MPYMPSPKRKIARTEIVDCAIELISASGFAEFSVLKVAKAYGIRQSHLTYYFPTRSELMAAVADRLADRYAAFVEEWCREASAHPGHPIAYIIDQLVDDAVSPPTCVLFPALWEAANQDPNVAKALDRIYQGAQRTMIVMLGVDPGAPSAAPLWDLIRMLGVVIEGTTAVYGRQDPDSPAVLALKQTVKAMMVPAFDRALEQSPR
jgi:AcrR family transcriptional regulator